MTREEAIKTIKELMIACTPGSKYYKVGEMAIKALEQEPKTVALLEKTYADFCNSEGGEGWLKIDGKEYTTDVGYAIEGLSIFMEVFKQRLAERGGE